MRTICWIGILGIAFAYLLSVFPASIGQALTESQMREANQSADEYLEAEVEAGRLMKRALPDGRMEFVNPALADQR